MKQALYRLYDKYKQRWQVQQSPIVRWGVLVALLMAVYAVVLAPSDYAVSALKQSVKNDTRQIDWMVMAGKEMQRLSRMPPQQKKSSTESAFALVNESIDEKNWNNIVNEVRQSENGRVQITFKSVEFNELIGWLQELYAQGDVAPVEVTMKRQQVGVVSASLVLSKESS